MNVLLQATATVSSAGSKEHSDHQAKPTTVLNSPSRSSPEEIDRPLVFHIAKELDITLNLPKGDQTNKTHKVSNLRKEGGKVKGCMSRAKRIRE